MKTIKNILGRFQRKEQKVPFMLDFDELQKFQRASSLNSKSNKNFSSNNAEMNNFRIKL